MGSGVLWKINCHSTLKKCSLKLDYEKRKAPINLVQKRRRVLWARSHLRWTEIQWKHVFWSDESPRYLNSFTWDKNSSSTRSRQSICFMLRTIAFLGADPHPNYFTLGCEPIQWVLKVTDRWCHQDYIICKKQRCNPWRKIFLLSHIFSYNIYSLTTYILLHNLT